MSQCAVQEVAAWGGIRGRNLSTGGDLRLFSLCGRSSSVVPAVRAARHLQGGDGLAFPGLFEKLDKGKRSIVAFSELGGSMRINYHWRAIALLCPRAACAERVRTVSGLT